MSCEGTSSLFSAVLGKPLSKSSSAGSLSTRVPSSNSLSDLASSAGDASLARSSPRAYQALKRTQRSRLLLFLRHLQPYWGWWARMLALATTGRLAIRYRRLTLAFMAALVWRNGYFSRPAMSARLLCERVESVGLERGHFTARDGTKLHWFGKGAVDKPVILLCNGIGCRVNFWAQHIDSMSESFRLVMWDYRGSFQSSDPAESGRLSMRDHAQDLEDLMVHLGIAKAHAVLGWSMGVQVALQFASSYGHRVEKVLLMTGAMGRAHESALQICAPIPGLGHALRSLGSAVRQDGDALALVHSSLACAGVINVLRLFIFKPWGMLYGSREFEWIFASYFEDIFSPAVPHAGSMFPNLLRNADELAAHTAEHHLSDLPHDCLVVAGMLDGLTPAYRSFELHRKLQHSRLECWTFGTHFLVCEFPKKSMEVVMRFLHAENLEQYDAWSK